MFSPPRSPRPLDGRPYSCTAWRKSFNTVEARLKVTLTTGVTQPIIETITTRQDAFSGIGAHMGSDALFLLGWFALMPFILVCQNDTLFDTLVEFLKHYLSIPWVDPEWKKCMPLSPNSSNPLAFNHTADKYYTEHHIHVYRRNRTRVPQQLYNTMAVQGLWDPKHIISM